MSRPELLRRSFRGAALAASFLAGLAGSVLIAAPAVAAEVSVHAEAAPTAVSPLLQSFRADALRDGILLRPLEEGSAVRSIELVDDGEVLVNGKEFDESELEAFLGPDGAAIVELLSLEPGERRSALGLEAGRAEARAHSSDTSDASDDNEDFQVAVGATGVKVRVSREDRVSVGRSITVEAGESARDVICIGCSIELAGEAFGDAVSVGGHLDLTGTVHGNAVSVGGGVDVGEEAVVMGDAVSVGGALDIAPGGQVLGQRSSVGFGDGWTWGWGNGWAPFGAFSSMHGIWWSVFRTGLLALLVGLCVLIARRSVEAGVRRVESEPWKALFAGLLTQMLFFPVLILVSVVLAVSIIGIPLLVLVPVAVLVILFGNLVGFAGVATVAGRAVERRFGASLSGPFLVAVVGVVAIQAIAIVGRVIGLPGGVLGIVGITLVALGFCIKYVAWTVGLGSIMLVALGRDWRQVPPPADAAEPESAIAPPELPRASRAPEPPADEDAADGSAGDGSRED